MKGAATIENLRIYTGINHRSKRGSSNVSYAGITNTK
jgi:hypothetical protein